MATQIYNGGIWGGILRIAKDSGAELSEKDQETLDYLESLPKNTWISLDENGMAISDDEAAEKDKAELERFHVVDFTKQGKNSTTTNL